MPFANNVLADSEEHRVYSLEFRSNLWIHLLLTKLLDFGGGSVELCDLQALMPPSRFTIALAPGICVGFPKSESQRLNGRYKCRDPTA